MNGLVRSLAGVSFAPNNEGMAASFRLIDEIQQSVFLDTASSLYDKERPVFLVRPFAQSARASSIEFCIVDPDGNRELRRSPRIPNLEVRTRGHADATAVLSRIHLDRKREQFRLQLFSLVSEEVKDRTSIKGLVSELNSRKNSLELNFDFDDRTVFLRTIRTSFVLALGGRGAKTVYCSKLFPCLKISETT